MIFDSLAFFMVLKILGCIFVKAVSIESLSRRIWREFLVQLIAQISQLKAEKYVIDQTCKRNFTQIWR